MSGQTYIENYTNSRTKQICDRYLLTYLLYLDIKYINYTQDNQKIYFVFLINNALEKAITDFYNKKISIEMPKYISTLSYLKTIINQIKNG